MLRSLWPQFLRPARRQALGPIRLPDQPGALCVRPIAEHRACADASPVSEPLSS